MRRPARRSARCRSLWQSTRRAITAPVRASAARCSSARRIGDGAAAAPGRRRSAPTRQSLAIVSDPCRRIHGPCGSGAPAERERGAASRAIGLDIRGACAAAPVQARRRRPARDQNAVVRDRSARIERREPGRGRAREHPAFPCAIRCRAAGCPAAGTRSAYSAPVARHAIAVVDQPGAERLELDRPLARHERSAVRAISSSGMRRAAAGCGATRACRSTINTRYSANSSIVRYRRRVKYRHRLTESMTSHQCQFS